MAKGLKGLANQIKKEIKEANKPVGEQFIDEIDKYLIASRSKREEENSISIKPSSYYKCIRSQWYSLLRFPKKKKWYPRSIRILENGTTLHEWIQREVFMDMENFGECKIKLIPPEELPNYDIEEIEFIKEHDAPEMEVKFRDRRHTEKYPVSAMIDGFMEFINQQMLFEFKTIKPEDFALLFEPLKDHIKQGAIYALCLGVPRVMFLYYDKGEHHFKAYLVEYNDDQVTWAKMRIQQIEEYLLALELPPKEESSNCRFCDYKDLCEKDACGKSFEQDEYGFSKVKEL